MVELYPGELEVEKIFNRWLKWGEDKNYGAYITFVGIVRAEDGIEALSFDVYEPILKKWFKEWEDRAKKERCVIKMAHSKGNVPIHTSSYVAAVFCPHRKKALELIEKFVEDFKANAPIWKYDVKNGERIYAKERSQPIEGSGLLALDKTSQ
ncbi:MAG: molybdenum cofactor biosynthesis protein MoaE [Epsilonproteobacteria bacterium]|nr:molybdenum cofactor biosynthesis protein MoaE [Campylobacterota bacterium]